jgi:transformation/transcription domain-associated protein
LAIIAKHKNDDWFTTNAEVLQEILQKTISRDDSGILDTMFPILEKFISLYPFPNQEEESQFDSIQFHSYASTTISEGLRSGSNLNGVLVLLKVVIQVDPSRIEPYAASLMRVLAKFTKEHIALPGPSSPAYEGGVRNLLSILEISRLVVNHLGDQRRVLLTSLIQLIEKSSNSQLCPVILDVVRDWILHRKDVYPTLKEKAGLVQKMQSYERLAGTLWSEYLDLVYSIYVDPSLRRTDLTVRLEQSFLIGCRSQDRVVRQKFIDLFDASIPQGLISRLTFVLGIQSWEPLADHHWLYLALELIFTSAEQDIQLKPSTVSHVADDGESSISVTVRELINPMRNLLFVQPEVAHNIWVDVFPAIWSSLNRREQADLGHHILVLFSKEYHIRQATLRPNVIQSLLCGIRCCSPPINLPPHLLKYLGRTFGAWHVTMEILQDSLEQVKDDEQGYEATHDALVELYADLAEEDMFYGSWRRRTLYAEANAALSFEQNGMWVDAQELYETAQGRSRNGSHPFSEVEFELWEDHWILAAQKLQQWDVLMDLARNEGSHDLFLECAWRLLDWNTEASTIEEHTTAIMDVQTPRRKVFEALSMLTRSTGNNLGPEFIRVIDDAMQLSLRKWASLPSVISLAHVPLLQHFQQVLELQEAAQIFASLSSTTASSLEKKSGDMKHILTAWRERLPNLGDDITIWSDLVSWRQHVFTAINRFFSPFITPANQGGATANNASTIGYRGYHETAWITNRFAHVARKHHLMDVCHNSLNKIYTLPNIEISEAFLKLREQARCYYQTPSELHMGMDVINNTNLMYFSNPQKAEFYTLKAMFFTKLGSKDDANRAFASAVQMDMTLAKAWAEWGKFGDRTFQENPSDMTSAASAVSCYLQAAGLYKSAKSRPLLIRILWLLSVDDGSLAVSRAFDTYKGEAALWYWITLVPQLLISLSHREAKHARYLLLNLAKLFPQVGFLAFLFVIAGLIDLSIQALFFQLRTSKEEMVALKRSTVPRPAQQASTLISGSPIKSVDPALSTSESSTADMNNIMQTPPSLRQPFEYLEEIVNILKTAFPLLALTMETFVDQVQSRFKNSPDEDCYRYSTILLTESISVRLQLTNGSAY